MTPFSRLCFSPDQSMLAAGVEGRIHVLEGFKGDHLFSVDTGVPAGGSALDFCFSPDSQYLLAGAVWKSPQNPLKDPRLRASICCRAFRIRMLCMPLRTTAPGW